MGGGGSKKKRDAQKTGKTQPDQLTGSIPRATSGGDDPKTTMQTGSSALAAENAATQEVLFKLFCKITR